VRRRRKRHKLSKGRGEEEEEAARRANKSVSSLKILRSFGPLPSEGGLQFPSPPHSSPISAQPQPFELTRATWKKRRRFSLGENFCDRLFSRPPKVTARIQIRGWKKNLSLFLFPPQSIFFIAFNYEHICGQRGEGTLATRAHFLPLVDESFINVEGQKKAFLYPRPARKNPFRLIR